MTITASQVNELRMKTGAGMMDCKKALTDANGDIEKAIEFLRKKGAAVAAKRADRQANEGIVTTKLIDNKKGFIVEINCETDFVARSEDFVNFSNFVIDKVVENNYKSLNELLENSEVKVKLDEITGKVGEKVVISRIGNLESNDGLVVDYIHPGSKLGVLVNFSGVNGDTYEKFFPFAKDIAMQVAAMRPIAVYREDVSKEIVDKELEIYKELARNEGKPENILDKISQGRLVKFYQENCLVEQAYIKDNSKTINDLINEFNKNNNSNIRIKSFLRFHLSDENKN
ncbi:MAG: translation elongation factor Ts [Ignavibacterium sp.]